jgi:hypothetical protein
MRALQTQYPIDSQATLGAYGTFLHEYNYYAGHPKQQHPTPVIAHKDPPRGQAVIASHDLPEQIHKKHDEEQGEAGTVEWHPPKGEFLQ